MGFNDILQQHQQETSEAESRVLLEEARRTAARTAALKSLIQQLDPIVRAAFDLFVQEATDANFHAKYHFSEEQSRAWWALSFIPAANEAPSTDHITRNRNVTTAIVRINAPDQLNFEWHYWNRTNDDTESMQKLQVNELTTDRINTWLDSYQRKMLKMRYAEDQRKA